MLAQFFCFLKPLFVFFYHQLYVDYVLESYPKLDICVLSLSFWLRIMSAGSIFFFLFLEA